MSIDYNDLLYDKAAKEFADYKKALMQLPQEEVFEHSYETAIKQDLLCAFEDENRSQTEAKALYKLAYPLDACYQEWLHNDLSDMQNMRDTVDDTAKEAVKAMKSKDRESR